jgi:hypothetical protein
MVQTLNILFFTLGCDYFALHDIDLLPDNPNLDYGKPVKTGVTK